MLMAFPTPDGFTWACRGETRWRGAWRITECWLLPLEGQGLAGSAEGIDGAP